MRRERVTPKPLVSIHRVSGESTDTECSRVSGVKELHADCVVFLSESARPYLSGLSDLCHRSVLFLHFIVLTLSEAAAAP